MGQEERGRVPAGYGRKFLELADFEALRSGVEEACDSLFDEPTLDAVLTFLATDAGAKFANAQVRLSAAVKDRVADWSAETAKRATLALLEGKGRVAEERPAEAETDRAEAPEVAARMAANEARALVALESLWSGQRALQVSGRIDSDRDGDGEYGTILELTGVVGVRADYRPGDRGKRLWPSTDFSSQGAPLQPPILDPGIWEVDEGGISRRDGYCFRIYLPEASTPSGFLHESGTKSSMSLAGGGTGRISVDLSEVIFCAYAWPEKRGVTGNRAFFVYQSGDLMQSSNERAAWEGEKAPAGNSAYRGVGITSRIAVGTRGNDGDVWRIVP
ncbi:MAG: DUF2059 domain-containing protein [Planctomycetaceae bacterium]|nr:DUF2059 domain-containing protein [Planctomycetaceae bacterium]